MDIRGAIRLTVKDIPGGWDTAAALCGKSAETLRHAFSGQDQRYVPSGVDALTIAEHAVSIQSANCYAYADLVNGVCGRPHSEPVDSNEMDQRIARFVKETSDVVSAVILAKADGNFSANDRKRIHKEVIEALDALLQIEQGVGGNSRRR